MSMKLFRRLLCRLSTCWMFEPSVILHFNAKSMILDRWFSIMDGYGLDDRGSIPVREGMLSSPSCSEGLCSTPNILLYFFRIKENRASKIHLVQRSEMRGSLLPCPSTRVFIFMHRVSFNYSHYSREHKIWLVKVFIPSLLFSLPRGGLSHVAKLGGGGERYPRWSGVGGDRELLPGQKKCPQHYQSVFTK